MLPQAHSSDLIFNVTADNNLKHLPAGDGLDNPVVDEQLIGRSFNEAISASNDWSVFLVSIARIVVENSDCLGLWFGTKEATEEMEPSDTFGFVSLLETDEESAVLWQLVQSQVNALVRSSHDSQAVCRSAVQGQHTFEVVVSPVLNSDAQSTKSPSIYLAGCFSSQNQAGLRQQWLLTMATQAIDRWQQIQCQTAKDEESKSLQSAFSLIASLAQSSNNEDSARLIVNHVQRTLQCDQVLLALGKNIGAVQLAAISGVEQIDAKSELAKTSLVAAQQPMALRKQLKFTIGQQRSNAEDLALENYCLASSSNGVLAIPLMDADQQLIGSILISDVPEKIADVKFVEHCQRLIGFLSGQLKTVLRANRGLIDTAMDWVTDRKRSELAKPAMIAACVMLVAMWIPLPYRVACDCEIQPVLRRYVASPYEGVLQQSLVESGDIVDAGQVVARLDGRALRVELAGVTAEFEGAKKRRDSSLATGNVAESHIATSEMSRHEAQMTIIKERLEHLDVRSPLAGMVVAGDLEKATGAPLEMGQTLFEVAPLETMVAEVAIPESEIDYVKAGMVVDIKVNAFPFKTFAAEIVRVQPRAEVINDQSVFVAEVKLANENRQLRPGMQGSAKVNTGWSPVGWNLFHRPWESVRYWTVW
jgi:biotin carboxyl carrier protein